MPHGFEMRPSDFGRQPAGGFFVFHAAVLAPVCNSASVTSAPLSAVARVGSKPSVASAVVATDEHRMEIVAMKSRIMGLGRVESAGGLMMHAARGHDEIRPASGRQGRRVSSSSGGAGEGRKQDAAGNSGSGNDWPRRADRLAQCERRTKPSKIDRRPQHLDIPGSEL